LDEFRMGRTWFGVTAEYNRLLWAVLRHVAATQTLVICAAGNPE
jgi:hypothetical protein